MKKVDIGNADIGLRREILMNQPTYPFALRQDKKHAALQVPIGSYSRRG